MKEMEKDQKGVFGRILQIDHSFKVSRNMLFYRESSTILTRGHGELSQNMIKDKKSLSCGFIHLGQMKLLGCIKRDLPFINLKKLAPLSCPIFFI